MHIKKINGLEIKFHGPDLHKDEIQSIMADLQKQIEEIDNFPDRSLFFQNPKIFDGWQQLVRTIRKIDVWGAPDDDTEWEDRTETYVSYLLGIRELYIQYVNLYKLYYDELQKLLSEYGGWLEGYCISAETLEALYAEHDPIELDDASLYLTEINADSLNSRKAVYKTLTDIFFILSSVIDSGLNIVMDLNPSFEDFILAIDNDLREWHYSFGNKIFEDMREELNRYFKPYRTAPYTPELWSELLSADEDALLMASRQELKQCDAIKQEHWGEDMKEQMDQNGLLMRLIYSSCRTEKLFDLKIAESSQQLISLLTPDTLSLFYDIIVRRNIIQCEMFPELKKQYEEWLENNKDEQNQEVEDTDFTPTLPAELATEQAMKYWEQLKQKNFVDDQYQLLDSTTRQQTMYIAEIFAEKMNIKSKWKTFEDFWGINNLAQEKNQSQELGKLPSRSNEIDEIFE